MTAQLCVCPYDHEADLLEAWCRHHGFGALARFDRVGKYQRSGAIPCRRPTRCRRTARPLVAAGRRRNQLRPLRPYLVDGLRDAPAPQPARWTRPVRHPSARLITRWSSVGRQCKSWTRPPDKCREPHPEAPRCKGRHVDADDDRLSAGVSLRLVDGSQRRGVRPHLPSDERVVGREQCVGYCPAFGQDYGKLGRTAQGIGYPIERRHGVA